MKLKFELKVLLCRNLYIPHGSDETDSLPPHLQSLIKLYIPHGSDETTYANNPDFIPAAFISHTVQMKLSVGIKSQYIWFDFISHTVQMKLLSSAYSTEPFFFFISHTVQMKPKMR